MKTTSSKKMQWSEWLRRLDSQMDLDRLIQDCCRALLELTEADRCSIMVLDGETEELAVRWAQGLRVKPYGRMRFKMGEGLCGWVARSQKPFFSFDVNKEVRFVPYAARGKGDRFRRVKNFCCLPLLTEGRTVGVVNLSTFRENARFRLCIKQRFTHDFVNHLARLIAQAMLLHEAEAASQRWRRICKAASETVAQVSHEVRNPLSVVIEGAQQLLDGIGGDLTPQQRRTACVIRDQADRLVKLVTELLDLSRIEVGRFPIYRRPMNLADLLRQVTAQYAPVISQRQISFEVGSEPIIYGDRARLTQVVENLLTNAVKFTPAGGSIILSLKLKGNYAEFGMSDTGIGISTRDQRRLFERFFQPQVSASLAVRGTGLGLAIVREIVQLHGGSVRVDSQPSVGTTFTVSLPLYTPAFALTEEFRLLREQAAREGLSLGVQLFLNEAPGSLAPEGCFDFLQQHLSKGDRVLVNPTGGLMLLSVCDSSGFQALRKRLQTLVKTHPPLFFPETLRVGWVLVPQEATELAAVMRLAEKRASEGQLSEKNP